MAATYGSGTYGTAGGAYGDGSYGSGSYSTLGGAATYGGGTPSQGLTYGSGTYGLPAGTTGAIYSSSTYGSGTYGAAGITSGSYGTRTYGEGRYGSAGGFQTYGGGQPRVSVTYTLQTDAAKQTGARTEIALDAARGLQFLVSTFVDAGGPVAPVTLVTFEPIPPGRVTPPIPGAPRPAITGTARRAGVQANS
jgi:hypothetical protein